MTSGFDLPGYHADVLLGSGRTGEVWRCRDDRGNVVALKRLRGIDTTARERLRRDSAVLSSIGGDHVVRVRDVVVTQDDAVVVMDYAAGGSLESVLSARDALSAPEVVTLVGPLAITLGDAHERGLIHGAITAATIMFTDDGRPMLTDLGLVELVGDRPTDMTVAAADDVHALCSLAAAVLAREHVPPELAAAIESGLGADPHERPKARELGLAVLRSCAAAPIRLATAAPQAASDPPPAAPARLAATLPMPKPTPIPMPTPMPRTSPSPRPVPSPTRRRLVGALTVTVLLVLAVVGGASWGRGSGRAAAVLPPSPSPSPVPMATATPNGSSAPTPWLSVVRSLDRRRAAAFAAADARALPGVYSAGSPALAVDLATLRAMSRAGVRARGFVITTESVRLVRQSVSSATLRVADELSRYQLVDRHGRVVHSVKARRLRWFTMTLTRWSGDWRIATVSR